MGRASDSGTSRKISIIEARVSGQTPSVELSAASVSTLKLPVHLDAGAVVRGVSRAVQRGRLKGEAFFVGTVRTPWGKLPLDLTRSGKIDFR